MQQVEINSRSIKRRNMKADIMRTIMVLTAEPSLFIKRNDLEAQEDKDGIWRSYVNGQVALYHHQLFSLSDALLCIGIPDFELVYRWRGLQEEKLRAVSADGTAVMDQSQINRFIQHFERLTRHDMQSLPQSADLLITLDESHMIVDMKHTVRNA